MIIRCPVCDFKREFADESIPTSAITATCPKCGTKFKFRDVAEKSARSEADIRSEAYAKLSKNHSDPQAFVPHDSQGASVANVRGDAGDNNNNDEMEEMEAPEEKTTPQFSPKPISMESNENPSDDRQIRSEGNMDFEESGFIPWEEYEKYGIVTSFFATILRVLFHPQLTLSSARGYMRKLTRPVVFFILLGFIKVCTEFLWMKQLAGILTDPQSQQMFNVLDNNIPMTIIMAPALLFFQLYFYAGIFYLMLRLVQPDKTQWSAVFRVIAYGAATDIFCVVPFIGHIVSPIWYSFVIFVGIKSALGMSWKNTAIALIPVYLIAFAVQFQVVMQTFSPVGS